MISGSSDKVKESFLVAFIERVWWLVWKQLDTLWLTYLLIFVMLLLD